MRPLRVAINSIEANGSHFCKMVAVTFVYKQT